MNKDLVAIFEHLEKEKGIKREIVVSAIEESLQTAAKKSVKGASNVSVDIDSKTGKISLFSEKRIVEDVEDPNQEISLEDARELDPSCELDQFIDIEVIAKDFGRIAAQKARQIITQKLRSAEKDVISEEFRHRIGELISGTVKRFFRGNHIVVDLGKAEAILPNRSYPQSEHFQVGERLLAVLKEVKDTDGGGAEVILSRSDPLFVFELFKQEVPEIDDGIVVIDKVVREGGYRTKLAVHSTDSRVDPVGACVGMRGNRVKNIIRETNGEKIDIIPFSEDRIELLQNALAPIEIRKISTSESEEEGELPVISIVVEDDDYGIVLGKKGMNIRLCGRLINAQLEVQKMSDYSRLMALQINSLAQSDNPELDKEFSSIEGINSLIVENLISEGYLTARKVLMTPPSELAKVPGVSLEMADEILNKIRNL